jgi:formylglycine-generating enzyme required for sulfatase activity
MVCAARALTRLNHLNMNDVLHFLKGKDHFRGWRKISALSLFILLSLNGRAQEPMILQGKVIDAATRSALAGANISLLKGPYATSSNLDGTFELLLPAGTLEDTLTISYIGYRAAKMKVLDLTPSNSLFALTETPTLLDEVTILEKRMHRFEIKQLEASLKVVKEPLYASKTEVTNKEYSEFLGYLLRSNQSSLFTKYKPDVTGAENTLQVFFKNYYRQESDPDAKGNKDLGNHPVVGISIQAAVAYCEWLTDLYNSTTGKKKFGKVKFRLPDLKEWRVAALGFKEFQSWTLDENEITVGIPKNPGDEISAGKRKIPFKGSDILYPWYYVYAYHNKAQNRFNCWLGNFKIRPESPLCPARPGGGDGFPITGRVAAYFPNGMGLFDVVGNVAEMINENGKACGGSWNHFPEESTILSINTYTKSDVAVGFRLFMEVIEEK